MRKVTKSGLNLRDPVHAKELLRWLNRWGCRQFAVEHHVAAGQMLAAWSKTWEDRLPASDALLSDLDLGALEVVADSYADLKSRQASERRLSGERISTVTVGPTGAAKILHALRPKALPPWDAPIRVALHWEGSRGGYLGFLFSVQDIVRGIEREAAKVGIAASEIPRALGRPASTLPKMIDEYSWVMITRGHKPPSPEEIRQWAEWAAL